MVILTATHPQANPFKERILEVFSDAGDGNMNFEQFLDMMSQLSSKVRSLSFIAGTTLSHKQIFVIFFKIIILWQRMRFLSDVVDYRTLECIK
jgi:hypothetical protein